MAELLLERWGGKPEYRGDVDNRVKALQDCLSLAGIIQDDRT